MTNAEAIEVINRAKQGYGGRLLEALDMAIAALALMVQSLDELPNQEEITCLSELRASYSCFDEKEEPFYRALSKGIEALRKSLDPVDLMRNKQKADDSFLKSDPDSVSKDDVIYRQAALNTVRENTVRLTVAEEQGCEGHVAWSADVVYRDVIEGELLELPSAQPEITHCVECIHWKHSAVRDDYCEVFDWMSKEEDFCSFAERKAK